MGRIGPVLQLAPLRISGAGNRQVIGIEADRVGRRRGNNRRLDIAMHGEMGPVNADRDALVDEIEAARPLRPGPWWGVRANALGGSRRGEATGPREQREVKK